MTWLAFAYFLSLGTLSYHGQIFDPGGYGDMILSSSYQTTLGVEAQLFDDHAFIGGSVQTWESQIDLVNFAPSEGIYTFSAGLRGWGFEIGYRHECDHAIMDTWAHSYPTQGFLVMRDEFYVSYSGIINMF